MKSYSFKKGPLILAEFFTNSDHILKIKLKTSDCFSATLQGNPSHSLQNEIYNWLVDYQNRSKLSLLPLCTSKLTPFRKKVLQALEKTTLGETLSYKSLAERSHSPKAYRAVGSTCKHNPFPLIIPCHRVICFDGKLGEFNGGVEIKKNGFSNLKKPFFNLR